MSIHVGGARAREYPVTLSNVKAKDSCLGHHMHDFRAHLLYPQLIL